MHNLLNASYRSSDGTLYFGSVAGLTAIDSNLPVVTVQPANIRFTRLRIGNENILPGNKYLPQRHCRNSGNKTP